MLRGQLIHQKLKPALALDTGRLQQILHQFEHRHDVPALGGALRCGRQELGKEQNGCREQSFCRIIEKGVLPIVGGVALGVDNGLGEDLGVLLRLGSGGEVIRLRSGDVHIAVDQSQQIIAVRAGGVSQIDHRHIVAVIFLRNRAVVPGQVALGVQCQEAHAAGAGIFEIGI